MDYLQLCIYSIIGAIIFSILGAIATKYRGDKTSSSTISRDAISGAIFVGFLQLLIPDYFPIFNFGNVIEQVKYIGGSEPDMDLQFTLPTKH